MAQEEDVKELVELVRTLLIVQLRLAGVPQAKVRAIARCDINRVAQVSQLLGKQSSED